MSRRRANRQIAAWETATRTWATTAARDLALDLYHSRSAGLRPYDVGVVLDPDETVWVEVPARFNLDQPQPQPPAGAQPPIRPWLVTSRRVVGRLGNGSLCGYRRETMVALRVSVAPGSEQLAVDIDGTPPLVWAGPGIAPMAVSAVFHLHGPAALLDHPGLAPLRAPSAWPSNVSAAGQATSRPGDVTTMTTPVDSSRSGADASSWPPGPHPEIACAELLDAARALACAERMVVAKTKPSSPTRSSIRWVRFVTGRAGQLRCPPS